MTTEFYQDREQKTNFKQHKNRRTEKRPPKKITPKYLENVAIYYLERYASSAHNLQQVLWRRIHKAQRVHDAPTDEEAQAWLEALVQKLTALEYLDDDRYTRMMVRRLHHQGRSQREIIARLRQKGLSPDDIRETLAAMSADLVQSSAILVDHHGEYEGDDAYDAVARREEVAAKRYVQRRRLTTYDTSPRYDDEGYPQYQKDLAKLARAGFSIDVARHALLDEDA